MQLRKWEYPIGHKVDYVRVFCCCNFQRGLCGVSAEGNIRWPRELLSPALSFYYQSHHQVVDNSGVFTPEIKQKTETTDKYEVVSNSFVIVNIS